MELVLEGLHQHSMLSRERTDGARTAYKDMLKSMLSGLGAPRTERLPRSSMRFDYSKWRGPAPGGSCSSSSS